MAKANPVQVQKYLGGINYPVNKADLTRYAEAHGADDNVRAVLQELPNQTFNSPKDVSEAIGKVE